MMSGRLPIWVAFAACSALLGCFTVCAVQEIDEDGCADSCPFCACKHVHFSKPEVAPRPPSVSVSPAALAVGCFQGAFLVGRPNSDLAALSQPPAKTRQRLHQLYSVYLL